MDSNPIDELKSPLKKLVVFFRKSRDGWKAKHLATQYENIILANKVRSVDKSRLKWKDRAQLAEKAAEKAREELHLLREELKKTPLRLR